MAFSRPRNATINIWHNGVLDESNTIRTGGGVHTTTYIAGISGADAAGGDPVLITSSGKLGTVTPSSARFKEDIKPMNKASEVLFALRPVTFRYKKEFDPSSIPQFGLVAEEVEKVNPDLAKRDRAGKLQTVRYDAINAMLLNEFLKEHSKVEEQQAAITELNQLSHSNRRSFKGPLRSNARNSRRAFTCRMQKFKRSASNWN